MPGADKIYLTQNAVKELLKTFGESESTGYNFFLVTKEHWEQVNGNIIENRFQARYRQRLIEAQEAEMLELRNELIQHHKDEADG